MRRLMVVGILTALFMSGCSGSDEHEQQSNESEETATPLPSEGVDSGLPTGYSGEVWYYVPQLPNGAAGWVADAGVRAVATEPAPGNRSKFYKPKSQAAPQPPECELSR